MNLELKRVFRKVYLKKLFCFLAVLVTTLSVYANKGGSSVPIKGAVPVNYYEGFMVGVALTYGIYLVVRARKRKRNSKISQ